MRQRRSQAGDSPKRRQAPADDQTVKIPHDAVNEQVLIAAVLVSKKARPLLDTLQADNFMARGHAEIWQALQDLRKLDLEPDTAVLAQHAKQVDIEYVQSLREQMPDAPANLRHHVECLKWDRTRVEGARGPVAAFLEALRRPQTEPDRVQALARQVAEAFKNTGGKLLRNSDQLLRDVSANLTKRRTGIAVYPCGIDALDFYGPDDKHPRSGKSLQGKPRMMPGFEPGYMTAWTGLSGSGKTTTMSRATLGFRTLGRRVCYAAWEQRSAMTAETLAMMDLGYSRTDLMTGNFDEEDQRLIELRAEEIMADIKFMELPTKQMRGKGYNNQVALDLMREAIVESGCDIFVADLLRRVMRETRPEEEEAMLYDTQTLAYETQTHIVGVHQQLGKEIGKLPDKRPTREGLKGSGAWFEVPDNIIGWHRQAQWKQVDDDRIEAIILKQRYGVWPQAVEFDWDPEYGSIKNGRTIPYIRPGESTEGGDNFDLGVRLRR